MPYISVCRIDQELPAWFERKSNHQTMPIALRCLGAELTEGRYHWGFASTAHHVHLQELSRLIAENPRLTTTWLYIDGGEGRGGSTIFTLQLDGEEVMSCDLRHDTYELGLNLETLICYLNHRLTSDLESKDEQSGFRVKT